MQSFVQHTPTRVIFGRGAEDKTAAEVKAYGGSRVMVVYGGGSVVRSGLLERVTNGLKEAGLEFATLGGVQPNPRLGLARQGVKEAIAFGADFILAVGGGSVIDTAKAIAHGTASPDIDIWEFWSGKMKIEKSLPVGVVLTISAAGSETSDSAVLTNEETGIKCGTSTEFNRPRFAIMNPELTFTLPPYQVACGIVDIMMHTMDRYFTSTETGNETTDAIAEAILTTVIKNGRIAMENSHDYEAMSEIMWCGSLSHNGITGLGAARDFTTHKLGHELSGMFDVAHGASLSAMWGSWALYSWQEHPIRYVKYARKVWGITTEDDNQAALEGIQATVDYFRSLNMPTSIPELGIGEVSDEAIFEMADKATRGDTLKLGCFKPLNRDMMIEIYQMANR